MRRARALVAALTLAVALAACGDDDSADDATDPAPPDPLRVLVTNDDGVDNPGVDTLVDFLMTVPDLELTVVTPAEERSGTGRQTTDGPVPAEDAATASGHAAIAVDGFPADAVTWALDGGIDFTPDLVVSGINPGQNIGPIAPISGTVGAALTASAAGIPSLAVSVGLTDQYDFSVAGELALDWIDEHRDALLAGEAPAETVSINVPSCPVVKELVEVPLNTVSELDVIAVDCDSTLVDPSDDVEGFVNGYAVLSVVPPFEDDD